MRLLITSHLIWICSLKWYLFWFARLKGLRPPYLFIYVYISLNPFTPDFLKWILPCLNWDEPIILKRVCCIDKNLKQNANWYTDKTEMAKVQILMKRLLLSHLIWIYTVCKAFFLVWRFARVISRFCDRVVNVLSYTHYLHSGDSAIR